MNFEPTHLKFNFSFITYDKDFKDEDKIALFDRMKELSSVPYTVLMNRDKKLGFEIEDIKINKDISNEFYKNTTRKIPSKYAIFRLNPNDNPKFVRVIGKVVNKVFYIFFIDIGGKLYNHGK